MGSSVLPIVLAGTGIALVATGGKVVPAGAPQREDRVNPPVAPPPSSPTGIKALRARYGTNALVVGGEGIPDPMVYEPRMEEHTSLPAEIAQEAISAMRRDFESLNGEAKREVCKAMKKAAPNDVSIQQLDCSNPVWESLVIAATTAAGAAAGTWLLGPYGGYIGAAVGAAVGKAVNEYLDGAWESVSDKAEEVYDEVVGWGEGVYEDAGEIANDVYDEFASLLPF